MSSRIICGDSREVLKGLEGASVDLVCTDPPYALVSGGHKEGKQHSGGFMGKSWDKALPDPAIWRECLRVLKPGGFALVMSGARSDCLWRLCRDLEEAGFDIALSPIYWVYRSGFPKALDLGKDFDKAAFVGWLKEPWNGTAETRAEAMGWGPAEVRKAASAAINGEWGDWKGASSQVLTGDRTPSEAGLADVEYSKQRYSEGNVLLTSLLARFPDAPGVRCKTGENPNASPGRAAMRSGAGLKMTCRGGGSEESEPQNITSPSTPLARQWDGWKSCGLKPAVECVLVAQKPFTGPVRKNVERWGVGGFNVEAGRVPFDEGESWAKNTSETAPLGRDCSRAVFDNHSLEEIEKHSSPSGRFPANLLCSDAALGPVGSRYFSLDAWTRAHGITEEGWQEAAAAGLVQVAKASKAEKEAGCEALRPEVCNPHYGKGGFSRPTGQPERVIAKRGNNHPTCKPVALMSYLCHLACPPGGLVLDPFCGSGSTGVAAVKGGWDFLGIELEPEYADIARARLAHAEAQRQAETPRLLEVTA